jgi:thiamine biosynthesis lipoprotein
LFKLSVGLLILFSSPPVTREVYLMGTRCFLTTYGTETQSGHVQLERYIRILEDTERELSVWHPDTLLSRLNEQPVNKPFALDARAVRLLEEVIHWSGETGGTFDPGIGKLLNGAAAPVSGIRFFSLDAANQAVTRKADVLIDSGAFGKGEGLDRIFEHSTASGDPPWIIDLGGQVMVYGLPPGGTSWTVDIAHPSKRDKPAMTLELKAGSISTSGVSENPGHIWDPRSQRPADFKGSVVVWHERGLIADILSTALFVMGPQEGLRWAEERGFAVSFLVPEGHSFAIRTTSSFRERFPTL